jgi:hypothetical protein
MSTEFKDGDGQVRSAMDERQLIIAFLGLVSAHFDIPMMSNRGKHVTKLNSGMAVITPAENVRELLTREDVMKERQDRKVTPSQSSHAATVDYLDTSEDGEVAQTTLAPNPKDRIQIPVPTKGEVIDVFKRASRKVEKK